MVKVYHFYINRNIMSGVTVILTWCFFVAAAKAKTVKEEPLSTVKEVRCFILY